MHDMLSKVRWITHGEREGVGREREEENREKNLAKSFRNSKRDVGVKCER